MCGVLLYLAHFFHTIMKLSRQVRENVLEKFMKELCCKEELPKITLMYKASLPERLHIFQISIC